MHVWLVAGSSQAAAPDTAGTFERGLMDSSQAKTSTCLCVCLRMTKSLPRQHASALESVSLVDSVPGCGRVIAQEKFELMNCVDE